ncbi:hypothetical protein P154DRAFT_523137 [Amniculicola lignicola CBS 123094]|uniref:Uncharacterized protein n=1 Tax=Amniculicola lignicola CBS 123094 TaxID=1392246 RepID=A0A6A5WPP5_9PLEO|nr:hypothetical protein P154DRAFT_523137 [Amniculicola lignicola CBS 123094]
MPKPTKRLPKPTPSAAAIPAPFSPAPTELSQFLTNGQFPKDLVYIFHLDHHPAWFKRRIFLVPVCLNVTLAVLLAWRFYVAVPFYISIVSSLFGTDNETTVHFAGTSWWPLLKALSLRGLTFLFDWLFFSIVGPWPWSFFIEKPENPITWRFYTGFRDEEVYVRQSRGFGAADLLGETQGSSKKAGGESPFFKTRILPAIDASRLREKTGYLLMDKDWDLDFWGMVRATEALDKKTITSELFRKSVVVWVGEEESGQWAVWDCWKLDEGADSDARKKIVLFKDRLTVMGKEGLFFKWVELVQFESNAPGGFTRERQIATAEKAKQLFEQQGVNFDAFIKDIGGLDGMPGMEEAGPD